MTAFALRVASVRVLARAGGGMLPDGSQAGAARRAEAPTPVRRDSIEAGTFEDVFFAMPAPGEPDRLLTACRRARDAGRRLAREARAGTRTLSAIERGLAALTAGAVRVFEEICTLARLNRGHVFPSYDWLAEATGLSRATVARGLALLERTGFLARQRRFKRVEGEGPRYRQTSNAYRALLPAAVRAYLPRWMRPASIPDDHVQHTLDRAEHQAAMLAGISCRDLANVTISGALGRVLARLGDAIDSRAGSPTRESQNHPQPLRSLYC